MSDSFAILPESQRVAAASALATAFDGAAFRIEPQKGGASSAQAYRVDVDGERYLMRIEGPRTPLRNPHQYACMRIAAEAGVAPPTAFVDEDAGIAIMRFVPARSLAEYPGGPVGLAQALGGLIRRLQATPVFPFLADYLDTISRLLTFAGARFSPGLLEPHREGFERIREVYPWDSAAMVSSHNDPNPSNILFDGERLWLIDWETAYRNDPLVDIAILANSHAATPDLESALLEAWQGRAPDRLQRARLVLMRQITALYYAALIFTVTTRPRQELFTSLDAPTPAAFKAAADAGRLSSMGPDAISMLGLVNLNAFQAGLAEPGFRDALAVVRAG